MNKFFRPVILFSVFGVMFSACSNGNYNASPTSGYNANTNPLDSKTPTFACGIGGYYFSTGDVKIADTTVKDTIPTASGGTRVDTFKILEIIATPEYPDTASHTMVTLGVNNYHGTGTYNMTAQSATDTLLSYGTFYYNGVFGASVSFGAIYITSSGDRLEGTFFFTPIDADGYVISSGTFNAPNPFPK